MLLDMALVMLKLNSTAMIISQFKPQRFKDFTGARDVEHFKNVGYFYFFF